jgi:hypothetical protein
MMSSRTGLETLAPRRGIVDALSMVALAILLSGCGGTDPGVESTSKEGNGTEVGSAGVGTPAGNDREVAVRTDGAGRKWFGNIPYDVWFAEPTTVAGNSTPVGGVPIPPGGEAEAPGVGTPAADPMPMPMATAGGGQDWGAVIPAAVLDAEMTDVTNRIKQSLVSVAAYQQSYLSLDPYIHSLAVMAMIAEQHPGDIRWKEHAPVIRELATRMTQLGTLMGGPKGKQAVEEPFVQIVDAFAGSPPSGIEPAEGALFSDVADMGALMKRLDIGFNKRLAIEVGDEAALKAKADLVRQEAGVIAALGKVIIQEGYGYAEDDDFKSHAEPMIAAGIQAIEAADSGDFAKFDEAKTRITKSCTDCHRSYR